MSRRAVLCRPFFLGGKESADGRQSTALLRSQGSLRCMRLQPARDRLGAGEIGPTAELNKTRYFATFYLAPLLPSRPLTEN